MKYVSLMRHAKSSWDDYTLSDHERPLNQRGRNNAPRMGAWFRSLQYDIDCVLCSTSTRTRETLDLFLSEIDDSPVTYFLEELYHASPEQMIQQLTQVTEPHEHILILSHNPGTEELMYHWSHNDRSCPTAAIGIYEFPELHSWSQMTLSTKCREIEFQIPKDLNDH